MIPSSEDTCRIVPRNNPPIAMASTTAIRIQSNTVNPCAASGLDLLLAARHVLAFGGVQFALASLARLLEVLMATQICKDSGLFTLLLESTQGAFEGFSLLHPDTGQTIPPSLPNVGAASIPRGRRNAPGDRPGHTNGTLSM